MLHIMRLLYSSKGQMGMMGPRKPISLVLGLAFLAIGGIPLLNQMHAISFTIPPLPAIILQILGIIGAVILLWDAMAEGMTAMMGFPQMVRMTTFVVAVAIGAIGLIPVLHSIGTIGFQLPVLAETILNVLYILTGFLLLYGGTQGF